MTIFPWRTRTSQFTPTSYLTAEVDAAQAAACLGVSSSRWRQISGPRTAPNPALSPILTPGQRGARWALRDVLAYALADDHDLRIPLPPLLPAAHPRYASITTWDSNLRPGYELVSPTGDKVWAQLFVPTRPQRCHQAEGCLLVLTPLWPSGPGRTVQAISHYVLQAVALPGWDQALQATQAGLSVVVLPSGEHTTTTCQVAFLDAAEIDTLMRPSVTDRAQLHTGWRYADYVPAADIAACLGWPALPWWPQGTATRTLCAQWEPGHPVSTDVPEALRSRSRAAAWVMRQEPRLGVTSADLGSLAWMVDPARQEALHTQLTGYEIGAGFELAVTLRWESTTPKRQGGSDHPDRALDLVLSTPDVPTDIARAIIGWVGDPTFAAPVYFPAIQLPGQWFSQIRDGLRVLPFEEEVTSPRITRMIDTHLTGAADHDPSYAMSRDDLEVGVIGPLDAPIIVDDQGLTICCPTGYQPTSADWKDHPDRALPDLRDSYDQITDVVLATSADGAMRGFYRTEYGMVAPLPAKSQAVTGLMGQAAAVIGACLHMTTEDVFQTRVTTGLDGRTRDMEGILQRSDPFLEVPWPDLVDIARRSMPPSA